MRRESPEGGVTPRALIQGWPQAPFHRLQESWKNLPRAGNNICAKGWADSPVATWQDVGGAGPHSLGAVGGRVGASSGEKCEQQRPSGGKARLLAASSAFINHVPTGQQDRTDTQQGLWADSTWDWGEQGWQLHRSYGFR